MTETETEETKLSRGRFFIPAPPIVLLLFAQALTGTVLVDLIMYRTCLVSQNINRTECFMLRTNASSAEAENLKAHIQPYVSMIVMAKSLMESIPPAVLSLFFGPWSDRGGRKPLLVAGFTGFTTMYVMLSLLCNWNISPWFLIIPSIPVSMTGGFGGILFASICYVSDTTAEKDRTVFLSWIQASFLVGYLMGIFAGPLIYKNYGFTIVFSTAAFCSIVALIYIYFCVPETVKDASKESICNLFNISFVKELYTSCFLKRDGFHRSIVWLTICIIAVCVMVVEGEISIGYLFTSERLGWDVQHYSYVTGAGVMLNTIGVLCGVPLLTRVLGFSDTAVTVIGIISALGGTVTRSFVSKDWHMYLAACIAMFSGIVGPVLRSIISKSVPAQDLGKVFALTASMETLSPLAGAPLYTLVYSHYLPPIYPSPVYLLSASCYILLILLVVWTEVLIRKSRNSGYVTLVQSD